MNITRQVICIPLRVHNGTFYGFTFSERLSRLLTRRCQYLSQSTSAIPRLFQPTHAAQDCRSDRKSYYVISDGDYLYDKN
jgi:hypothetical protein